MLESLYAVKSGSYLNGPLAEVRGRMRFSSFPALNVSLPRL